MILYVEWFDAQAYSGWQDPREYNVAPCKSVGFLVKETKTSIVLASAMSLEGQANAAIAIPKAWVIKRKKIKV